MTTTTTTARATGPPRSTPQDRCAPDHGAPAEPSTVGVVGLGYVGLPTALAFADAGIGVVGCDISEARLGAVKSGKVDLLESDHVRLRRFMGSELLTLTTDPVALGRTDAVLICVPTPVDSHLVPDLAALSAACATVVETTRPGQTIILTSTTYVGCTRDLLETPLRRRGLVAGQDVHVAFSPERIDPGVPLHTAQSTPRVVGGITAACTARAAAALSRSSGPIHTVSSPEAAELTKLLENTFRAVNIALANEFSDIARTLDVDVVEVIRAATTKPYGFMPFHPGPGVGGHCVPCDPHYLLWQLRARRTACPVTEAAMTSIAARPGRVVDRARQVLADAGRPLAGARILIAGIAYKPGVADVRESPALEIIQGLLDGGAVVAYTDPMVDSVDTSAGVLTSEPEPGRQPWDLVIAHTLHPATDHSWIARAPSVLDATYRLSDIPDRHVL